MRIALGNTGRRLSTLSLAAAACLTTMEVQSDVAVSADLIFFDKFESEECFEYEPDPELVPLPGAWGGQEAVVFKTYTLPASQRGGGIIQAELTSGDPAIQPRLTACVDQACSGGSIVGHTNLTGATAKVQFQGAPGQTYQFVVEQFGNAPPGDYPVSFDLTVDYSDRLDCWEINDQIDRSKRIVEGEPVEAYLIQGFEGNSLTSGSYSDWYRFDLRRRSFLAVDVSRTAGQHLMRIKVFDTRDLSGADVLLDGLPEQPGEPFTAVSTRPRDPGTYYVQIGVVLPDAGTVSGFGPAPPHWMEEYEMTVFSIEPR